MGSLSMGSLSMGSLLMGECNKSNGVVDAVELAVKDLYNTRQLFRPFGYSSVLAVWWAGMRHEQTSCGMSKPHAFVLVLAALQL